MSDAGFKQIFDRRRVRLLRRQASSHFIQREIEARLKERLADVMRTWTRVLLIGSVYELPSHLDGARVIHAASWISSGEEARSPQIIFDQEENPFARESFDLVMSNLDLHTANDLPGALVQIRNILKPDGLFIASLFAGDTLSRLREAMIRADLETSQGATARLVPFAGLRDLGGLLQRAGFALPMADRDLIDVEFDSAYDLLHCLKDMGEGNTLVNRSSRPLPRKWLQALEVHYGAGDDNRLSARFECAFLTGWAPHPDQPRPKVPGSAGTRLANVLGTKEWKG